MEPRLSQDKPQPPVAARGRKLLGKVPEATVTQAWPSKVPRVTVYFWVVKILTTAMGESTSDYLVHRFNPYLAVVGGFVVFVVALLIQFTRPGYVAWAYWLAVAMVAVFGTMAADVLHIQFGVPYPVSTVLFAVVLAGVFLTWERSEKTLSIHSIYTRRRESFYWAAVLATFAMGTAAGDLAAYTAHLGCLSAGLFFAVLFAVPAVGYRFLGINAILAFWFAYVLTRPLGASAADWLGKARAAGGLGYGDGPVALVLTLLIVALVVYLSITGKDREPGVSPRSNGMNSVGLDRSNRLHDAHLDRNPH